MSAVGADNRWQLELEQKLARIDSAYGGELGVYVKDLSTGQAGSLRADEPWYLASGIKVPVAITVLRNIEQGRFTLDTKVRLAATDYVDGAGETNWYGPGTGLSVRFLLEQMITVSDNTATDMLIRLVGIEQVNALVHELVPEGFGSITTLADVRRHAYSGFHPGAFKLIGNDFLVIRKQTDERLRLEVLAELVDAEVDDFAMADLDTAFAAYYATNLNGAQLSAYALLLEAVVEGRALDPERTEYLVDLMARVKTGERRIKAGLPQGVAFAHKTGTQHLRACDLGVALPASAADTAEQAGQGVIIVACSRGFRSLPRAEAAFREIAEAVSETGALTRLRATGDAANSVALIGVE